MNKLKCLYRMALAVAAITLTAGCASVYKPAAIVTITAEQAMESYGAYFDEAIQNPVQYGTSEQALWAQRRTVDDCWEKYRAAMNLFDDARQDYIAGKATEGDVVALLQAARENSQALADIVTAFLPYKYQPKP